MRKAVMMLAIMVLAGCGSDFEWFPTADNKPPTVTSFSFHAEKDSLTVHIDTLTASDNEGVTGYLITESTASPAADAGWMPTPPTTYTLSGATVKTLYAWARDAVGNVSTGRPADLAYTLQSPIPFPTMVQSVSDIVYDDNDKCFWLLASTSAIGMKPNALVQIDAISGTQLRMVYLGFFPFIDAGSSLAYDGTSFWVSSVYVQSVDPTPQKGEVYQIERTGQSQAIYPCPATSTGFCQGLTWDGTALWAAGSDNRNLVNFQTQAVNGALPVVTSYNYDNIWTSNGVSDAGYDRIKGELLVLKDGLITVNAADGALLGSKGFTLPGTGKGDWDGTRKYFWVVDNANARLLSLSF